MLRKDFHYFYLYREDTNLRLYWNSRDRVWDRYVSEATAYTLPGAKGIRKRLLADNGRSFESLEIGYLENGTVHPLEKASVYA